MNIDGYTLTEKMRKARRRFRFTATEQALFYELVAICNGEDWRDVFDDFGAFLLRGNVLFHFGFLLFDFVVPWILLKSTQ